MEAVPGKEEVKQFPDSQTASDFIDQQLALEADAREVLPYKFDKCTNILGPLRQNVFACLTCSPPPASAAQVYTPAGVCYACSISCHGEHTLVELFSRRDFVCDCGTSRLPSTSPCTLRTDPVTGNRGVQSQEPHKGNHYNHNFQNRFCACGEEYDAETEKGTMFQCLGLGTVDTGGCGEDWYHPECLMGLSRDWYKSVDTKQELEEEVQKKDEKTADQEVEDPSHPVPPGFPDEDDFDTMICYKCVESNPWIKNYAGTPGFLPAVFKRDGQSATVKDVSELIARSTATLPSTAPVSLKRKASDGAIETGPPSPSKRVRNDNETSPPLSIPNTSIETLDKANNDTIIIPPRHPSNTATDTKPKHKHDNLPNPSPTGTLSLFLRADFRDHLCHCPQCYLHLIPHPQLLEEEETYEPSLSSGASSHHGGGAHSRSSRASLLERGEAALSTMDRVRAIEGVMVYNHLRDKVKEFLKPYAESGKAVSAEDIKAYFEKLRGDESAIKEAKEREGRTNSEDGGNGDGGGGDRDTRREQSGY
ncbi:uncharacterized protein Z519_03207 [Cladophialophora bantiana CBS 173.52]|uniref:UBR-type domain-containing protein n=1 Tax=Cladophialophora bantiana (strain ATCC 10958 / CBS 173.52 / CDC B-1940 / NIH 8579) TaxID=1442370 RepID=A0A0D2HZ09_CLAB1|nr:uncharacterized protein Z519_03207 [Cladophialophora bantiana CBS 173.52]KIW96140.1 hypothetical protein Z519_03207 [Cladophialophora bantiana CBS 173.52]